MSCCSANYCQFQFPEGPPLTDYAVTNLNARYLFLPYGTLLEEGEVIRIWMESGDTKTVLLEAKIPLQILPTGPSSDLPDVFLPWQLIALDSGLSEDDIQKWYFHPLHNPDAQAVVLKFKHPLETKVTWKMRWLQWLYKIRTL
ncbi:MAG: hypothetical protein ACP5D0_01260 [Hydrogenovibrio sp.]